MRRLKTLTQVTAFLSLTLLALNAQAQSPERAAKQQWHQAIAEGYRHLENRSTEFHEAATDYCSEPSSGSKRSLDQAWRDAFLAWQRVRFVDFGPVEQDNLAWQFQFWPDPKNLIATKARYLLTSEAPITPELIDQSGVAVQGFPMAEYLLFDKRFTNSDRALPADGSCALLTTLSAHIESNAQTLSEQWQALKPHYLDTAPYLAATVKAAMTSLEILEERRLAQPMGLRGNGKRSVYAADAWRSGNSLSAVQASVSGLQDLFFPAMRALLEAEDKAELADRIQKQFTEVLAHFPDLATPMAPLLADDQQYARLQGFYVDVSQLVNLVNDQGAVQLGVVRGFNSSDGD